MIKKFHNSSSFLKLIYDYLLGFLIIFAALWLGKVLSPIFSDVIPASIIGMLLLCFLLQLRILRLSWVDKSASLFVRWMSLLFVPIGVGLVEHLESLLLALPAMLLTCVLGTLILLSLVGHIYQKVEK